MSQTGGSRSASGRLDWWSLQDHELLAQCEEDHYRASGPGGQKRNKTDSAVRLRHLPTGLILTATESRSRPENQRRALRRLRQALAHQHRQSVSPRELSDFIEILDLELPPRDPRYLPTVAFVLDLLEEQRGRIAEVAEQLGTTTASLARFLHTTTETWRAAQELRAAHGQRPLRG